MSRLVPKEVSELMEAYSTVYSSQELTEEQVWEEVENWVNSLVEEGYDLSEYTWEDMYDAYIEEQGPRSSRGVSDPAVQARWGQIGRTIMYGKSGQPAPRKPTAQQQMRQRIQASRPGAKPQIGSLPANYRGQELQQAARARASQVGTSRQGTAGGPTVGGNTPIGSAPTRPATPAARPAAPAARPAAPAVTSAPKPATPAATPAAAPAAKKPSIASDLADLRKMRAASQMRQAGANVTSNQLASFDPFDVIKGHLLDEGYADSEEAALAIMTNMSEEWKQTILEADSVAKMAERAAKRRQQRYGKQGGGGRDDFRPYTEDDYKNPKPGYGSGAASQAKDA